MVVIHGMVQGLPQGSLDHCYIYVGSTEIKDIQYGYHNFIRSLQIYDFAFILGVTALISNLTSP